MAVQMAPFIGKDLGLGDHVAFFFKSSAERRALVIPYIVQGLQNRERCVYIVHENTAIDILAEIKDAGVDTDAARTSGALSVVTTRDTYLRHGIFEPEKMIADLDRDVTRALHDGFLGLRVTGEMSWALDLPSALCRLCEYEQQLCRHWSAQLGGLCQYDESLCPADVMERMANCHCAVVRDGNLMRHHVHGATDLTQSTAATLLIPELRSIPVVMLTSSRQGPDIDECYRLSANAFVVKPVDFDQFIEVVKTIGKFWAVLNEPPQSAQKMGSGAI